MYWQAWRNRYQYICENLVFSLYLGIGFVPDYLVDNPLGLNLIEHNGTLLLVCRMPQNVQFFPDNSLQMTQKVERVGVEPTRYYYRGILSFPVECLWSISGAMVLINA